MNMGKILKQAQKMQGNLVAAQEEFGKKEFETSVGGGMVKIVMFGDQRLKSIKISPDVAGDVEMLEDMIVTAVNKLQEDIKKIMSDEMNKITGGLNIPGLFWLVDGR